jgi:hypothetical protein
LPPAPRAPATIVFHGQRIERRTGFVIGTKLVCPGGHTFKPAVGADAIVAICREQLAPGRICGAPMYFLALPAHGSRQPALLWFADVDVNDVTTIRDMSIEEVLTYFGVSFNPMDRTA